MSEIRISGVIHTKNEERHIEYAIGSLMLFADEVLVADMGSTDRTVEIARDMGAQVITVPDVGYVEPVREQAVRATSGDWIFLLDADEVLPRELGTRLRTIASTGAADAVVLPFLNYMAGAPVRVAGWGPRDDRHLRFFRRGYAELSPIIHAPITATADSLVLHLPAREDCCVHHFSYDDWSHWLRKMDRYTTVEAAEVLERGQGPVSGWQLCREIGWQVLWRYIYRRGFTDTYAGPPLTLLMVAYRALVYAKSKQVVTYGNAKEIHAQYGDVARRLLSEK